MISYSPQVHSVLIAAMLAKVHGDIAVLKGTASPPGLFAAETRNADNYSLPEVVKDYQSAFNLDIAWLNTGYGQQLKQLIQLNLRHNSTNYAVIMQAITEALEFGPQHCLQGVSPASRKFANQARTVQHEVHRMLGFVRFAAKGDRLLVTKPQLEHNTADLILRGFQPRYPDHKLVLLLDGYAVSIYNYQLNKEAAEPYLDCLEDNATKDVWKHYYQSQYIETRPNIALAQQRIPQKYWDWMEVEGEILKSNKQKPED